MLTGLVFAAQEVETPWYLKIDTDVVATPCRRWLDPRWFEPDAKGRPCAFIASPWSYTKPAEWIDRLEEWKSPSLTEALKAFDLWSPGMDVATAQAAPATASLALGTFPSLDQASVDGLAAGFSFGQPGEPVVPFVRLQEA